MNMAYCDYIAHTILRPALQNDGKDQGPLNRPELERGIIRGVGHVKMDLDPVEGYMVSTAKRIDVVDMNGTKYRITVEEI
jgi:hypothetical protein|tara:strand:- start:704 stop:943 length:240 start_codon:yes stop_codon:yes gene_type:complete